MKYYYLVYFTSFLYTVYILVFSVPELVRYLLRSNKSWIPTETTHTDTADSSSKPLSPTSGTATCGLIEQARSSILCSTEVQSSLCRAFDGLQTVQHPPVWNVLIDLCYFKIVKDKKKTPAEYLASSAPSATVTAAKQSIGSNEVPTSSSVVSISGQVNKSATIQDTSIKLNILNYNLCPLLSAMSQSVASSVHTVVLPESVLFRFFEKVSLSSFAYVSTVIKHYLCIYPYAHGYSYYILLQLTLIHFINTGYCIHRGDCNKY